MIIINLNIIGLRGGTQAKYLKHIITKEAAEFVCLQETKVTEFFDSRCFALSVGYIMKV